MPSGAASCPRAETDSRRGYGELYVAERSDVSVRVRQTDRCVYGELYVAEGSNE